MEPNDQFQFGFSNNPKETPAAFSNPSQSVAVYTVLCILRSMRNDLCLEAMVDYMEQYLKVIERHNPRLKRAVSIAMLRVDIEKIYKDAMS